MGRARERRPRLEGAAFTCALTEAGVIEPGVTEPPKLLKNEIDEL